MKNLLGFWGVLFLSAFGLSRGAAPKESLDSHGHHHDHDSHGSSGGEHRCRSFAPPRDVAFPKEAMLESRKNRQERRTQAITCDQLCVQCIDIGVYVHFLALQDSVIGTFIPHPTSAVKSYDRNPPGSVSASSFTSVSGMLQLITDQFTYLNAKFKNSPFRFVHLEPDSPSITTSDERWTRTPFSYAPDISAALHRGTSANMNLYMSYGAGEDDNDGTLGFVGGLANEQLLNNGDGVFIRYDNLPNGGFQKYDYGETMVHEVGHWLGLLHTFETAYDETNDPCDPSNLGDLVSDTPPQSKNTLDVFIAGGPSCLDVIAGNGVIDTCPADGENDPVTNFMNYVSTDECFETEGYFSCGQIERMYRQWSFFREYVNFCASGEMEVEVVIDFDDWPKENTFYLRVKDGPTIFNSTSAVAFRSFAWKERVMVFDVCLPGYQDYEFVLLDSHPDGLAAGAYYDIFQNGDRLSRLEGNFGASASVQIPATTSGVDPPTVSPTDSPTASPIGTPTRTPTTSPTLKPTASPTKGPSASPVTAAPITPVPSLRPSHKPSLSIAPSEPLTENPTGNPTPKPSLSRVPSNSPKTHDPTEKPSLSIAPSIPKTTGSPTQQPSLSTAPSTPANALLPTQEPSTSLAPTAPTSTESPTERPSLSLAPTDPTNTDNPTELPYLSLAPTDPSISEGPTQRPSLSSSPSQPQSTGEPTLTPSSSFAPSNQPSQNPTGEELSSTSSPSSKAENSKAPTASPVSPQTPRPSVSASPSSGDVNVELGVFSLGSDGGSVESLLAVSSTLNQYLTQELQEKFPSLLKLRFAVYEDDTGAIDMLPLATFSGLSHPPQDELIQAQNAALANSEKLLEFAQSDVDNILSSGIEIEVAAPVGVASYERRMAAVQINPEGGNI